MAANEETITGISAAEFAALDPAQITVVDLREPDEVLIHELPGALNIPFSQISTRLDLVPKEKPVYVICRTGELSEEVTEILTDRGYTAYNVEGGYAALQAPAGTTAPAEASGTAVSSSAATAEEAAPAAAEPLYIDARSLRCPGPIVKVADTLRSLPEGSTVRVEATEDAFFSDIQVWCERTGNKLDTIRFENGLIDAQITKAAASAPVQTQASADPQNDKTFIVFSGDLDKTIASFILANGAAALGRNVTMFFTFWGLNILRRPEKVNVAKSFIEKMFGIMMPRGTKKLGLSRMNMGGAGPKMIRAIMKKKGISSLEELIEDAKAHGVRLVACQMSMDIMGIHQEELIDGIELGGVATFLGSGEKSDISLFI